MAAKLYYKIGEACKLLDIQPYVLRYWETEFPALSPTKSKSGQRVYGEDDLGVIRRIKELLYDEGYTIAGAKKKLESEPATGPRAVPSPEESATGDEVPGELTEEEPEAPRTRQLAKKRAPARKKASKKKSAQEGQATPKALLDGIRKAAAEARKIEALLDTAEKNR